MSISGGHSFNFKRCDRHNFSRVPSSSAACRLVRGFRKFKLDDRRPGCTAESPASAFCVKSASGPSLSQPLSVISLSTLSMTHTCYTVIFSQKNHAPACFVPCNSFRVTGNFYSKASQELAEQQLQRTLQVPNLISSNTAPHDDAPVRLVVMAEAMSELGVTMQCTLTDPAAIMNSLTSLRFCSKAKLRHFASQFKPASRAKTNAAADCCKHISNSQLQHVLCGIHSANASSCLDVPRLQVPVLPAVLAQVCSSMLSASILLCMRYYGAMHAA